MVTIPHGLVLVIVHPNHIHGLMIHQGLVCLCVRLSLTTMLIIARADANRIVLRVLLPIRQLEDVYKLALLAIMAVMQPIDVSLFPDVRSTSLRIIYYDYVLQIVQWIPYFMVTLIPITVHKSVLLRQEVLVIP